MIKIRELRKEFSLNGFILQCRSLDVEDGKCTGVHGGTGSGKTLFAMLLSGLIKSYEGSVLIDLTELKDTYRKKIGFVPFKNILYENLKVDEMFRFIAAQYKIKPAECNVRTERFSEYFDIKSLRKRKIFTLSSGELQQVKIISSLIHSPSVLIIDEPFNGLGTESVENFLNLLGDLRTGNVSVIALSSHKALLSEISDNTVTIDQGEVK